MRLHHAALYFIIVKVCSQKHERVVNHGFSMRRYDFDSRTLNRVLSWLSWRDNLIRIGSFNQLEYSGNAPDPIVPGATDFGPTKNRAVDCLGKLVFLPTKVGVCW